MSAALGGTGHSSAFVSTDLATPIRRFTDQQRICSVRERHEAVREPVRKRRLPAEIQLRSFCYGTEGASCRAMEVKISC
jgi:hypothetical protein